MAVEERIAVTMPLIDLVDAYLKHLKEDRALTERTILGYGQELRLFVRQVGSEVLPQDINREHVLSYLKGTGKDGKLIAPSSRNRKLIVLHGFCRFLVEQGVLARDPSIGIGWAKVHDTEKPHLDREDYRELLRAIEAEHQHWLRIRDHTIIQMLFHTGLRVSELAGIELGQVDLDNAMLNDFRRKGGSEQTLPLNREVVTELRRWLKVRCQRNAKTDHLFIGRTGKGLGIRRIEQRLNELGEQAGISIPVTPHTLRHLHATELVRASVNMEVVKRLMNHRSITTTSRYSHVGFDVLQEAVERLVEEKG